MPTAPLPRIATYRPRIEWGTGTPIDTSEYDDVRQWYRNEAGLVIDGIGRDQVRAYAPPSAPTFDLTLSNHGGRFSPGGPLAQFLGRGPAVTLDVDWGADVLGDADDVLGDADDVFGNGTWTKRLFDGHARDMTQALSRTERTVSVTALGNLASLVTVKPRTTLYENVRTDEAIAVLLDAAGWPAEKRQLDTGDTTLLFWWLDGQTTAMAALNAILAAEGAGGCAYEDGDGVFHFEGRQFRDNNPRSTTIQWAFFDGGVGANALGDDATVLGDAGDVLGNGRAPNALYHMLPSQYTSNPDEVVRTVAATINHRTATSTQKIWEYGGPLVLSPSQVLDIEVKASDPFKSAVTPILGTDYSIGAGSLAAVSLLSTSGQTVTLRLTAGVSGATVIGVTSDGIQGRAISLPVTSTQVVTSTIDTTSSAPRMASPNDPLNLGLWPEVERNQTLDLVNSMALRYRSPRRQVQFTVQNVDANHMHAILDLRPSDRIQYVHTHGGLNLQLWVERIDYDVSPGGGLITMTVGCEQVFDLSGGRFDTAQFDVGVFGV